jgi:hypothetical protein
MNMLSEGGNVFKDADGVPVTQRINREDVKPTLAWLERLLPGLDIQNNTLGSTGIKDTSGDLDIAVDANQVTKQQLEAQLARWATAQGQDPRDWVRKSGTAVHFKTPIAGDAGNGFVQTDFMLLNNVPWSKFVLGAVPPDSQYKGRERNVMMNSIAKSLGYKLNQVAGIADRATNQIISADPDQVAKILLNPQATRQDLASVESIARALASDPKRDSKLADFREHMARENLPFKESVDLYRPVDDVGFLARLRDRIVNQGMQPLIEDRDERVQYLREAKNPRIPYVEDLVFQAGLRGARQAVDIIRQAAANAQEYVTIKWDGSPAVIFGRNEQGEFVLTDKAGATAVGYSGLATSPEQIAQIMSQRDQTAAAQGKRADRVQTLLPMYQELWPLLQAATPRKFQGYLKGDMLYSSSDPYVRDAGNLVFNPNKHDGITYRIPESSELGQKIAASRVGVAIHTRMDDPGSAEQPETDPESVLKRVPGLMVTAATVKTLQNLQINRGIMSQLTPLTRGESAQALQGLLNPAELRSQQITDLPALMERYINSLKGTDYSAATPESFVAWLQTAVTPRKYNNTVEYLRSPRSNMLGMQVAFDIWNLLHALKQDLQRQLDLQQPGQEGWVFATPAGRAKLVSRTAGGFGARKAA